MLGILGGAFDPIHYGHLSAAWQVYETLGLDELRLMPCHIPPHRAQPFANNEDRLNMLKLAIDNIPGFTIDDRELKTNEISYTVNSLTSIRKEMGDLPICLLLGRGVFSQIATWHQPEKLLTLAHIVVVDRPEEMIKRNDFIDDLLKYEIHDPKHLKQQSHGLVYLETNTPLGISSTLIRQMLAKQQSPRFLLPEPVLNYIHERKLYV